MQQSTQAPRGFRFGVFEVDLRAGEVHKDGRKVRLQEQPFQVLAMLLERAGEVVTREDVQKKLWTEDTFVDFEHGLNIAINKIREALGDSAENPRFVETLPKRGYRFIAPVVALDSPKPGADAATAAPPEELARTEPTRPKRAALRYAAASLGGVAALAGLLVAFNASGLRDRLRGISPLPQIQSIAVLPLENLSGDPDQEYFADAMTDALITDLGQLGGLRVISRTSVTQYKGVKKTLPEIARELNVDAIVEGTVLRSGGRVRITAQLLHAPTDRHLWAQSYDRDLRDVLELQSEVARAIVTEVRVKLTAEEHARLAKAQPVQPEAYDAYLKGAFGPARGAAESFERAISLDPDYAPAYAGIGSRYYTLFGGRVQPDEAFSRIKDAALKALEKDNALPEAYALLGLVRLHYDWNWADAERNFKRGLELSPNSADMRHYYAHYLLAMGRGEESVAESQRAAELAPLSAGLTACLGWHHLFAAQYDQAVEQGLKAIQMNSNNAFGYLVLGWGYEQKSMFEPAITAFEKAVTLTNASIAPASLAHALALAGKRREAEEVLAKLTEQSRRTYIPAYDIATVYAGLGAADQAFEWLEKAYREHSSFLVHVNWDPRFRNLHSDPRFHELVRRIGLPS